MNTSRIEAREQQGLAYCDPRDCTHADWGDEGRCLYCNALRCACEGEGCELCEGTGVVLG